MLETDYKLKNKFNQWSYIAPSAFSNPRVNYLKRKI